MKLKNILCSLKSYYNNNSNNGIYNNAISVENRDYVMFTQYHAKQTILIIQTYFYILLKLGRFTE